MLGQVRLVKHLGGILRVLRSNNRFNLPLKVSVGFRFGPIPIRPVSIGVFK